MQQCLRQPAHTQASCTTKLETVGAMRTFGYVVQQWTAAAHFEQDNDGCLMAHSNQTFTLLINVDQHHHRFS